MATGAEGVSGQAVPAGSGQAEPPGSGQAEPARGGRPTAAAAAGLADAIVAVATAAFLRDGYAATSIEAIARQARVGKRTLYARFPDKESLFRAVLERLMARWLATPDIWPDPAPDQIEPALVQLAERMLAVALEPEALALHRLLIAETGRFPHIPIMLQTAGASAGVSLIAALLGQEVAAGHLAQIDPAFAAEQFMTMVISGPRRRALGLGPPLDPAEITSWARRSVALFLDGCRHSPITA
jgi:AcrR family transcriptional regulator